MTTETQQFDVTEAERQLIECLREQANESFRLEIRHEDGAWELAMSARYAGKQLSGRGVGATFDQAWGGVAPGWA